MQPGRKASKHAALMRFYVEYLHALSGLQDRMRFGVQSLQHRAYFGLRHQRHNARSWYAHAESFSHSRDKGSLGVAL